MECTGVGTNHEVAVSLGFQRAVSAAVYSYDAALLRGMYVQR